MIVTHNGASSLRITMCPVGAQKGPAQGMTWDVNEGRAQCQDLRANRLGCSPLEDYLNSNVFEKCINLVLFLHLLSPLLLQILPFPSKSPKILRNLSQLTLTLFILCKHHRG